MPIPYNPKDAASPLIPDGEYDAKIESAEAAASGAGDYMIKLAVRVWAQGREWIVFDRIVPSKATWKLGQLADAIGKAKQFDAGSLELSDIAQSSLRVELTTKKDPSGQYKPQNNIKKYLSSTTPGPVAAAQPGQADPF